MIDLIIFSLTVLTWAICFRPSKRANLRRDYWPGIPLTLDDLERQRSAQRCNREECE